MSIYLVALNEPSKLAWETIQTNWPAHHLLLTDHLAFMAPDEPALTSTIAETIGMNDEEKVLGIVVELGNKSGYNQTSLNEWLSKFS